MRNHGRMSNLGMMLPWMVGYSPLIHEAASRPVDLDKPFKVRKSQRDFTKILPSVQAAWATVQEWSANRPDSRQVIRAKQRARFKASVTVN